MPDLYDRKGRLMDEPTDQESPPLLLWREAHDPYRFVLAIKNGQYPSAVCAIGIDDFDQMFGDGAWDYFADLLRDHPQLPVRLSLVEVLDAQ